MYRKQATHFPHLLDAEFWRRQLLSVYGWRRVRNLMLNPRAADRARALASGMPICPGKCTNAILSAFLMLAIDRRDDILSGIRFMSVAPRWFEGDHPHEPFAFAPCELMVGYVCGRTAKESASLAATSGSFRNGMRLCRSSSRAAPLKFFRAGIH
jgi:hypothetical protein